MRLLRLATSFLVPKRNRLRGKVVASSSPADRGIILMEVQPCARYTSFASSENEADLHLNKTLATDLAFLLEESTGTNERRKSRFKAKRSLELRIKKRVKEQYRDGKFQNLMFEVIASIDTLQDAYGCILLDSNIEVASNDHGISFETIAKELRSGSFDFKANSFSISSRDARKEVLVLPNLKLRIIQVAIRIVLEVVYRPHFSKISHGCRSGRGINTALKYISKEISSPNWWFTISINKNVDICVMSKLFSIMEKKITDNPLFSTIQGMFDAGVLNFGFGGFTKGHGLPQEGVLCPILVNIYLDLLDCEFLRLLMKYEVTGIEIDSDTGKSRSSLRNWFRRQLRETDPRYKNDHFDGPRVHCCRLMDEIFFAVSGPDVLAQQVKSDMMNYMKSSLHLDVDDYSTKVVSCDVGIRFLGILAKRSVRESPAMLAVHKLKEKVKLFTLQKEEAWNTGTVRIGKKWLAHGLKKVKESEIKHLSDGKNSSLSQISELRKAGMETDHWYKVIIKVWMQGIKPNAKQSDELILSKYAAEPALPQELKDSYYDFLERANGYISSETASCLSLLQNQTSSAEIYTFTEIVAPIHAIKKRLMRYGLITPEGYPSACSLLVFQDKDHIVDWFSGIVSRWLRWYGGCSNFNEIKVIISDLVRKSCIRTLAAKFRIHEKVVEKQFDSELSRLPATQEVEQELTCEATDSHISDYDEALAYGISQSGLVMLSLARIVSQSRSCNCFIFGCTMAAPRVYTIHVMERQKFPSWKTGFCSSIHPSLHGRRIGLCNKHLKDLFLGHISLQSVNYGAWSK